MRLPQLDERLSKAANMIPACGYGVDIGADHGRLSCFLLANNTCERMCVSDLSAPSLEKAKRLLRMHSLEDRADFCVGDGLNVLPQRADAVAILGMGGKTIAHILKNGQSKLEKATLIVSAHTEVQLLRKAIVEIGYSIKKEDIAYAGGRFYVIIQAQPGQMEYTEKELLIGPVLLKGESDHYLEYLSWRKSVLAGSMNDVNHAQREMIEEEWNRASNRR